MEIIEAIRLEQERIRAVRFLEGLEAKKSGKSEYDCPWRMCKNATWWREGYLCDDDALIERMSAVAKSQK